MIHQDMQMPFVSVMGFGAASWLGTALSQRYCQRLKPLFANILMPIAGMLLVSGLFYGCVMSYGQRWYFKYCLPHPFTVANFSHYKDGQEVDLLTQYLLKNNYYEFIMLGFGAVFLALSLWARSIYRQHRDFETMLEENDRMLKAITKDNKPKPITVPNNRHRFRKFNDPRNN